MTGTIRVAVVDGHTLLRYGLAGLAAEHDDLELVGEAGTAAETAAMVAASHPDVVTLDVALPDGDGMRTARELRDRYPELGIVLLTSDGQDDVLFRALETGVSAFVTKTAPAGEVLAAIRHAAVAATSFTATGLAEAVGRRTTDGPLSPREREVLTLLGEGLSVPAIARTMFISRSTAKTYVARVYDKLGASNRAQALMIALHENLIDNTHATTA